MSEFKELPTYEDVISKFHCENQPNLPAELHGFMCGVLCGVIDTHSHIGFKTVLARLQEEGFHSDEAKTCLATLMLITAQQLQDADFSFQLLLPSDKQPVEEQVNALAGWSQGFLGGLGLARMPETILQNTVIKEALADITEIGKTKDSPDLAKEESEAACFELIEFVRMAVLLIYTQCAIDYGTASPEEGTMLH